jgi:hypothetical protein
MRAASTFKTGSNPGANDEWLRTSRAAWSTAETRIRDWTARSFSHREAFSGAQFG